MARRDAPASSGGGFGDLLKAKGFVDTGTAPPATDASEGAQGAPSGLADLPKVVLRVERKGRGGKTVTLVQGLELDAAVSKAEAKKLKKALSVGVKVEPAQWVVQGDQRERVAAWLTSVGVTRVVS